MRFIKQGQGATEYLVLLAVVLIVALVSVALLGFFPGMASDTQMTQSQTYWQSASPIAVIESSAYFESGTAVPYIRIRNTGAYQIIITKVVIGNGSFNQFWGNSGCMNFTDYYSLSPGEEKNIQNVNPGNPTRAKLNFGTGAVLPDKCQYNGGASAICQNATGNQGTMILNNFGFEYIQYIEGQQLTKRQVGSKPLMIKCTG